MMLADMIVSAGLCPRANGFARRLIVQGAVSVDGTTITDPAAVVAPTDGWVDLRVAKGGFARVRASDEPTSETRALAHDMPGVREYTEGDLVKLIWYQGRLCIHARNEGGNNETLVDLLDVLDAVDRLGIARGGA